MIILTAIVFLIMKLTNPTIFSWWVVFMPIIVTVIGHLIIVLIDYIEKNI